VAGLKTMWLEWHAFLHILPHKATLLSKSK
jgi:hypothetical protein